LRVQENVCSSVHKTVGPYSHLSSFLLLWFYVGPSIDERVE